MGGGVHLSAGGRYVVRVGIDGATEFTLGAPPTSVQAVSVAGGVRAHRGPLRFAAHVGPAVVWGRDRSDLARTGPTREPYVTAGLVANGSAVVQVAGGMGFGLDVSGNLNPELSTLGARLAAHLRLGRAR